MGYKLKYVLRVWAKEFRSKLVSIKFHQMNGRIKNLIHTHRSQSMFNWMKAMLETILEVLFFTSLEADHKC